MLPFFRRRPTPSPITRIQLTDRITAQVPTDPDRDGRILSIETPSGPLDLDALRRALRM